MKESARIDKWLWAARIYKTRSIAADACKNGRVTVGGVTRKPSFIIKRGDVVSVKKAPVTYSFEVLDCIEHYKDRVKGFKITGAGGGGYLVLINDTPVENGLKIRIRRN